MTKTLPIDAYAIIIGAMKCGTSSLYAYLVEHPEICPCIVKEPEYFSEHQSHRYLDAKRYEDLWDFNSTHHRYALEASTGYSKYTMEINVPHNIYAYGIRPKFIYIVRNPFDRILSNYYHSLNRSNLSEPRPLISDRSIYISNYHLQLSQYRALFDKQSILVLDFDELMTTPQTLLQNICDFLNLDTHVFVSSFPVCNRTLNKGNRTYTTHEKKLIHARLAEDMKKFHSEYGFDVTKWGFSI